MKHLKVSMMALMLGILLCGLSLANPQKSRREDSTVRILREADGGYLGIDLRDVRREDVSTLKLSAERGAVIGEVLAASPAAEAGLKENDVIVEFDGEIVHSAAQLRRLVRETPVGRSVNLVVVREGQHKSFAIKLGERKESRAFTGVLPNEAFKFEPQFDFGRMPSVITSLIRQPVRLGVQVQNLTEQLADYLKVPGKSGVLIASVNEGSAAQKAGLKAGDVIVGANGKSIQDTKDLSEILREEQTASLKLDCIRSGQKLSVTVALEPSDKRPRGEGIRM